MPILLVIGLACFYSHNDQLKTEIQVVKPQNQVWSNRFLRGEGYWQAKMSYSKTFVTKIVPSYR